MVQIGGLVLIAVLAYATMYWRVSLDRQWPAVIFVLTMAIVLLAWAGTLQYLSRSMEELLAPSISTNPSASDIQLGSLSGDGSEVEKVSYGSSRKGHSGERRPKKKGQSDVHRALRRFKRLVRRLSTLAVVAAIIITYDSVSDLHDTDAPVREHDPCDGEEEPGCIPYNYGRGAQLLLQLVGMIVLLHYAWAPLNLCGNKNDEPKSRSSMPSGSRESGSLV